MPNKVKTSPAFSLDNLSNHSATFFFLIPEKLELKLRNKSIFTNQTLTSDISS